MKVTIKVGYAKDGEQNWYYIKELQNNLSNIGKAFSLKGTDILSVFSQAATNPSKPDGYSSDDIIFEFAFEQDGENVLQSSSGTLE